MSELYGKLSHYIALPCFSSLLILPPCSQCAGPLLPRWLPPLLFLLLCEAVSGDKGVQCCTAGQLTTALVPTVPSPCFLRQSATVAKVRETFWCVICPYPLRDRRVVVGGWRSGRPLLGPGLVRVVNVIYTAQCAHVHSHGDATT